MYGWEEEVRESFTITSFLAEYILKPVDGLELDFLAGPYFGGHNGNSISSGIGLEGGLNAGIRLGRHYVYYMFRGAFYADYSDGDNTFEDSFTNGIGYRYLFGDEPLPPPTLAEQRRKEEWRVEDAQTQAGYPVIGLGAWGGISLDNEADNNEDAGLTKYPVTGLAFLDLRLTENFGFALETGVMSFEREENISYSTGFGSHHEHHGITASEFIVSVFEEFSFPLGSDFQLDLLAGLYYGGRIMGPGFEYGANLRLRRGNHSFAVMFRMGESFRDYDIVNYGYNENEDEPEEILVIGGGYIYSFQAGSSPVEPVPSRYTQAADEHPADAAYPFVRTGGWWGQSTLETDNKDDENAYVFTVDILFSDYFALGVEAGSMPFRMEEYFPGYSRRATYAYAATALAAQFILRPSDTVEASVLLGSYYRGGENAGLGLLYCGANVGFVTGRHHVFGLLRYAQDGFSASEKMTTVGGGYKYDLY
jgi:hypothetical protein